MHCTTAQSSTDGAGSAKLLPGDVAVPVSEQHMLDPQQIPNTTSQYHGLVLQEVPLPCQPVQPYNRRLQGGCVQRKPELLPAYHDFFHQQSHRPRTDSQQAGRSTTTILTAVAGLAAAAAAAVAVLFAESIVLQLV